MWGPLLLTPPQTLSAPSWGFCLAAVPAKPTALIQPWKVMEMPRGPAGPGHAEKPL